jgi:hypothetical protein
MIVQCKTGGSHNGGNEKSRILSFPNKSLGKKFSMFQRTVAIHIGLLDPVEVDTTSSANTGNYTPKNTQKCPGKLQSSGKQS